MCTYTTAKEQIEGSAKGPGSSWFRVSRATVYFDHPVHAAAGHSLNVDLADPDGGPNARVALELTASSARALAESILAMLDAAPSGLAS